MSGPEETREQLRQHIEQLEMRLEEAESTLQAIRHGEVDALVVSSPTGPQVYTLHSADHPYRILVQEMQEGALTLTPTGLILYANLAFARMMRTSLESIVGTSVQRFVVPRELQSFLALFAAWARSNSRGEMVLQAADGTLVPAFLACNSFRVDDFQSVCLVVTDLTEQKRQEEILASEALARAILEQAAEALRRHRYDWPHHTGQPGSAPTRRLQRLIAGFRDGVPAPVRRSHDAGTEPYGQRRAAGQRLTRRTARRGAARYRDHLCTARWPDLSTPLEPRPIVERQGRHCWRHHCPDGYHGA